MANNQTYIEGYESSQITTLSYIQGAGLNLPTPTSDFINIRGPGKIEALFNANNNASTLYTKNKYQDSYLKGPVASSYIYTNIESGQRNKLKTPQQFALVDSKRITKFLKSSAGTKFVINQLILQGQQSFDETKVYNPTSPIISALRLAAYGVTDRPTRHIDTSNIIGGLLGGTGLGNIVNTIGGFFGGGESQPSPPRSSVASEASRGFGLSTFTSMLGGGDRSDQVVSPLARGDIKDLLRGKTATNAYNAPRYSKLINKSSGGGFLGKMLNAAGKYLQNNTVVGGILPPKQPWAANYRADEQTYDLYIGSGKLFDTSNQTKTATTGIVGGILNAIGFGKKSNYSLAVRQRFQNQSTNKVDRNRYIAGIRQKQSLTKGTYTDEVGYLIGSKLDTEDINIKKVEISSDGNSKYSDNVYLVDSEGNQSSDQLLNYKILTSLPQNFSDTFSDKTDLNVNDIINNLNDAIDKIASIGSDYYVEDKSELIMQQFSKKEGKQDDVGFNFVTKLKKINQQTEYLKYNDKWNDLDKVQPLDSRGFSTYTHDFHINNRRPLNEEDFNKLYLDKTNFNYDPAYGIDIIKFYFYDIVNRMYIPFRATVKSINENNSANWETIEYLGRPDKLYYYKGFERQLNFGFTVNANSIKELMPMWSRINYLTSLVAPSNYTLGQYGGFMVPPMVQLTIGDYYKNHFVIITSCNVTIPDDASWETISEDFNKDWFWGPNEAFKWKNSKGKYAQFPRTAEIQMSMNILAKDRSKAGTAWWGDSYASYESYNAEIKVADKTIASDVVSKEINKKDDSFSYNIRTDNSNIVTDFSVVNK